MFLRNTLHAVILSDERSEESKDPYTPQTPLLSFRPTSLFLACHPERSAAESRDLLFLPLAMTLHGDAPLTKSLRSSPTLWHNCRHPRWVPVL